MSLFLSWAASIAVVIAVVRSSLSVGIVYSNQSKLLLGKYFTVYPVAGRRVSTLPRQFLEEKREKKYPYRSRCRNNIKDLKSASGAGFLGECESIRYFLVTLFQKSIQRVLLGAACLLFHVSPATSRSNFKIIFTNSLL